MQEKKKSFQKTPEENGFQSQSNITNGVQLDITLLRQKSGEEMRL